MKENPTAFLSLVRLLEEAVGQRTGYALLDPFPCKTLEDGQPAVVAIQNAGRIISQHVGLADYMFVIAVTAQKPNTAAHIELDHSGRDVFVELSPDICEYKDAVLATLCHELSHKFLYQHGIRNGTVTIEQEFLTDVTAVYLGLGKIMLNGCECQSSRQWTQNGRTSTETHTLKTGYISRDCFAFVYRLVCAMRGISRETFLDGLSGAAREAVQRAESNYADWFNPEFRNSDGAAIMGDSLKTLVEACQDDSASRHRILRRSEEKFRAIKASINQSHKPLVEAQQQIARIAEPEPNPHLTFLNCLQTRESVTDLIHRRNLKIQDVLSEWKQVEALASLRHDAGRDNINEIVECPIDGSKLRVPLGRKRLLVTCPTCKYKFMVNTDPDAGAAHVTPKAPSKLEWMPQVKFFSGACIGLVLLVLGCVAWGRHILFLSREPGTIVGDSRPSALPASRTINDGFIPDNNQGVVSPQGSEGMSAFQSSTADPEPSKRKKKPVELPSSDVEFDHPASAPVRSLPTGTRLIEDRATTGHGELEVINGTPYDACLIVVDANSQTRVRKVYIKAHDSLTLGHLVSGEYSVLFTTGEDWNNSTEEFNRHESYYEFGKSLSFEETSDSQGVHYEHHSITLHPVPSGNVHANFLTKSQFHSLAGKM